MGHTSRASRKRLGRTTPSRVSKDPQCKAVYAWETEWADWNRGTCTLTEMREIVHWACGKYGLTPPAVKQHHTGEYSYSQGPLISFNLTHKNPAIALHESAHYICDQIFGPDLAHHCPEWMAVYLWLLEGWRLAPRKALHASAKARGIRWLATWLVSPKRLKRKGR